jgi:mono/diheme cytochrome c family protein
MEDGQALFVQRCTVCHEEHGPDYPPLANNSIVQSRNPDTVLRVILQGSQSAQTATGAIGFSMPAFPVLDDKELADVATYIRNAWSNRASPVSEREAGDFRKTITPTR